MIFISLCTITECFLSLLDTISNPSITGPLAIDPDLVIIDTKDILINFDGPFMPDVGFVIGVTLEYRDSSTHIATFSVRTTTTDV